MRARRGIARPQSKETTHGKSAGLTGAAAAGAGAIGAGAAAHDSHSSSTSQGATSNYDNSSTNFSSNHGEGYGASRAETLGYNGGVEKTGELSSSLEREIYTAGHNFGSNVYKDTSNAKSLGLVGSTGAGASGAAATHGSQSSKPNSKSTESKARPVIEVIGISDRLEAQKVAQQTTRELVARGEDLLGSKIVINANSHEVYKEPILSSQTEVPARHEQRGVGSSGAAAGGLAAGGLAGGAAAKAHDSLSRTATHSHPDASFNEPVHEVDGRKYHKEHQKVMEKLEHEAEEGHLGNIPGEHEASQSYTQHESHGARSAAIGGVAGAGAAGAATTAYGASHLKPDASFNSPVPEVDGSAYHKQHEQVRSELERDAERGTLGNIHGQAFESQHGGDFTSAQTSSAGHRGIDDTVQYGSTTARTQPDASFHDDPVENDGSWDHAKHEKVKQQLEQQSARGNLGNIPAPEAHLTSRSAAAGVGIGAATLGAAAAAHGAHGRSSSAFSNSSAEDPLNGTAGEVSRMSSDRSYSNLSDIRGKSHAYTEVTVSGESDPQRSEMLAKEAVSCLHGRQDILQATELKVDAYTGAITDQDGHFIAQLGQRKLSQVEGMNRKPSGGIVSPPPEFKNNKESAFGHLSGSKQQTDFGNQVLSGLSGRGQNYDTTSRGLGGADNITSSGEIEKMPGSFF